MDESVAGWVQALVTQADVLLPTLTAKTFFILSVQLFMTWLMARLTLDFIRHSYAHGAKWVTGKQLENGFVDLQIRPEAMTWPATAVTVLFFVGFFLLALWGKSQPMPVALLIFSLWSAVTGVFMALALIRVNENLGSIVLAITVCVVLVTGLMTQFDVVDLSHIGTWLFWALLVLIGFNVARLFLRLPTWLIRFVAALGVTLFVLYLLHDFGQLAKAQAAGVNTWSAAFSLAIELYLDIINLFLELLDLVSD